MAGVYNPEKEAERAAILQRLQENAEAIPEEECGTPWEQEKARTWTLQTMRPKLDAFGELVIKSFDRRLGVYPKEIQLAIKQNGGLNDEQLRDMFARLNVMREEFLKKMTPKQMQMYDRDVSAFQAWKPVEDKPKLVEDTTPQWDNQRHLHISGTYAVSFTETAQKLFGQLAETCQYFSRGGQMVIVAPDGILEEVNAHALRSIPESHFDKILEVNENEGELSTRRVNLTKDICEALLHNPAVAMLPEIATVADCPILYEAGDKQPEIHHSGYLGHAGGIWVRGGGSKATALEDAVTIIEGVVKDFDFLTQADGTRAIAMLLTPALV
jgi:hypothetical protein